MLVAVEVLSRVCPLLVLCWLRDELEEEAKEDDEDEVKDEEVVDVEEESLKEVLLEIAGGCVETIWLCLVTAGGVSHEAAVVVVLWFC